MNFFDIIKKNEKNVQKNVSYPGEYIEKFNLQDEFDYENYNYLINRDGGAGYIPWLTGLLEISDSKTIVELGNRYGCSTIGLFKGLKKDQKLISIDLFPDQRYIPELIWESQDAEIIIGDCLNLSIFNEIPIDIDILFSDTEHTYSQIKKEYDVYKHLLSDGALVVIDDIFLNDKHQFYDEWQGNKVELSEICHVSGFAVLEHRMENIELSKEERSQNAVNASMRILCNEKWEHQKALDEYLDAFFMVSGKKPLKQIYRNYAPLFIRNIINIMRRK